MAVAFACCVFAPRGRKSSAIPLTRRLGRLGLDDADNSLGFALRCWSSSLPLARTLAFGRSTPSSLWAVDDLDDDVDLPSESQTMSLMIPQEAALGAGGLWIAIANIWFVAWAVRHRGELDYELDSTAKLVRWLLAITCLGVAIRFPQLLNPPPLRVCIAFLGVAFVVWPNFAYYLTRLLRSLRMLPRPDPKELNNP